MRAWILPVVALAVGCAHRPLAGGDLDRVVKPAFVSRIEEGAGPKSEVFRDDDVYRGRLKKLEPREADRRLQVKLGQGISRFEVSDRFRASTLAQLPHERPWTDVVDPALVGKQLESFLVEEVPANPPDYELLKPLGADSVVEFVVQDYGMRSEHGRAGAYVKGYGRMFFIDGGEIWHRDFDVDGIQQGRPALDPFQVAKQPELFRAELAVLIDGETAVFAKDLTPSNRKGGPPLPQGADELEAPPDSTNKTGESAPAKQQKVPADKPKEQKPKPNEKKPDDAILPNMEDQPAPIDTTKDEKPDTSS